MLPVPSGQRLYRGPDTTGRPVSAMRSDTSALIKREPDLRCTGNQRLQQAFQVYPLFVFNRYPGAHYLPGTTRKSRLLIARPLKAAYRFA